MLFYVGRFSYNFTCNILVYLGSFSCTLQASSCGQFLLHVLCCFMSGVSLTHPVLFPVGSFTDTLDAVLCGEFLLHASCCSTRGISLTRQLLFYVGIFSYMPLAALCGEFLLHPPYCFMWGVSLPRLMLFYVGSFSYMLHAVWCREFLLHAPCCFMCWISLTRTLLFYVGSFSYIPRAVLCGEFLFHAPCCFMWGVLLHIDQRRWERIKVTGKERQRQGPWGYSAAPLAYTAAHDTDFVGTKMASMGLSARSGHSRRWFGKYGPIGAQRPLSHRIWLRLSIASHGSEQTGPFPCICLKLWAQEICLVCTFQCPNIALPRTTLGLCTASWPNLTIQALVGSPSYTRPSSSSFMGRFLLHVPYATFWGNVSLTRPVLVSPSTCVVALVWVRSLPYTPHASFSGEFLLHVPGPLVLVRSLSYTPHAGFSGLCWEL